MNSAESLAARFKSDDGVSYTEGTMTDENAMHDRLCRSRQGGNSLGQSRLAMSEVQICGIPKLSSEGVAPTP
jgi:hypothetical protein